MTTARQPSESSKLHGQDFLRRGTHAGLALALLILATPVLVLASLFIVVSDGVPVLFRSRRAGIGGDEFTLLKLRSMKNTPGADEDRLTSVGRFLRSWSIDELPQLWNVVRGDMALVGPRPLPAEYTAEYTAREATRLTVRPGLTGLSQVSGRNGLTWDERLELDAQYVEARSMRLDLYILARTANAVTSRKGVGSPAQSTGIPLTERRGS